jgi:hypothetical protein
MGNGQWAMGIGNIVFPVPDAPCPMPHSPICQTGNCHLTKLLH